MTQFGSYELGVSSDLTPPQPSIVKAAPGEEDALAPLGTHQKVRELLDAKPGSVVADAGAGRGAFTRWLVETGYRAIALGIDRYQFSANAPFIQCNLDESLPLADESVSAIVAVELIEHLENPFRFIRDATRCLAPSGTLLISTPNVLSVSAKVSFIVRNYFVPFSDRDYYSNGHISPVQPDSIRRMAERCGLVVIATAYSAGKLPVPWLRHKVPLRASLFRNEWWADSVIVKLRKVGVAQAKVVRG